jgi:hypothetical protein
LRFRRIRFATRIGWYVSLVPAHVADPSDPHNFRSYDREMLFPPAMYPLVDDILAECVALRRRGFLLYDSPEFPASAASSRTGDLAAPDDGVCDSPGLYFAIRPNGDLGPSCGSRAARELPRLAPGLSALVS